MSISAKEAVLRSVFICAKVFWMAAKNDWRVFVFVRFCAKIYHGVFVAMTEGTGGAGRVVWERRCEYHNNICQHQLVVGPELKRLEAKKKKIVFFIFTNFVHDLHFEAIEFFFFF